MSNRTHETPRVDHEVVIHRRELLDALRSGEHIQKRWGVGHFCDPSAPVCFYGLVLRLGLPLPAEDVNSSYWAKKYGITQDQFMCLISENDRGYTFPQLAFRLEGFFNT